MKNGKLLRRIILSSTSLVIISASTAWSAPDTVNQTISSWNRQEYDVTNNATDPLDLEINRTAETYTNTGVSSLTNAQTFGPTALDITGIDLEVIATIDQSILDGDELVVIDDSASSDFDELSAAIIVGYDALQENTGNIFQSSTQDFTSDADIAAGDVSQYGAANQSAQFGSEILVDSEGTYEVTAGVINAAARYAGNELVFSLYAAQSSAAGGNVAAGNVSQQIDVTQLAQIGAEVELVSSGGGVIEAAILNIDGTETLNLSEGNVVSLQENNAAGSVQSGNVVQTIAVDQSGGILNHIILVSSDAGYVYGNILSYSENYAANFAANEVYSGQVNQNDGDLEVDVVDQSSTIAQASSIRNEITIEAGSDAGIYAAIGSGGENYAVNEAVVSIEAGQENSSLGNVVAGDTDQSLLTEQAATIWNGITIETDGYTEAYAQIENVGVNWAYNVASGNGLAAVQENQGLDVEAGDVDQSLSIEQSVVICKWHRHRGE